MNERIRELVRQCGGYDKDDDGEETKIAVLIGKDVEKFAELIVRECMEQVEQAKNSPFVSLDDAKRMTHFVDVTKKKIQKHFGV